MHLSDIYDINEEFWGVLDYLLDKRSNFRTLGNGKEHFFHNFFDIL